jgi:hypothetical protein
MKWAATAKIECAACGGSFTIPTADLLSLLAVCPGCGASLASAGEERLTRHAEYCHKIDLFNVWYELLTEEGIDLSESEVDAAQSLEDLTRAVASRLPPAEDCEARAAELVTKVAERVAPELLHAADYIQLVVRQTCEWWRRRSGGQVDGATPEPAT